MLKKLALHDKAKVAGLAWQEPERFDFVPVKGLASNILCERHNHALSGLDSTLDSFATAIRSFDRSPMNGTMLFSGSDLERWMLKCLLGLTVSKNITSELKSECVELVFGRMQWPEGWGLYFSTATAQPIYHTDSFLIRTRVDPTRSLILAGDFFIQGLPFVLVMGKPDLPKAFGVWRPLQLFLESNSETYVINFAWDETHADKGVTLRRVGTYDGHPPNWKEWEKNG